jgi:deoxyadenosine/deoxycytidine kinase
MVLLNSFDSLLPGPAALVYLRTEPEQLLERVRSRGRGYETGITADYLQALQDAYDRWITTYTAAPVIVVDTGRVDLREDGALTRLVTEVSAVM